jgi:hypothetical protein
MVADLDARGWARFPAEPATLAWAQAALQAAREVLADPAMAHWWLHGRTWFVGVDALPNDAEGRVAGGPLLSGAAVAASGWHGGWHRAQVSAVRPGYPKRDPEESEAAHRFRRLRDAAHVDGLKAEGSQKRRFLREPHAFVLGIVLTEADPSASPLVVWEGSHEVMRAAFRAAFDGVAPDRWGEVDLTEAYHAARREVFETCQRVELPGAPGEAVLLHRLVLHGVAPWCEGAVAAPEGRIVAYFRPTMREDVPAWIGTS